MEGINTVMNCEGKVDCAYQSHLHCNAGFLMSSIVKIPHSNLNGYLAGKLRWKLYHLDLVA